MKKIVAVRSARHFDGGAWVVGQNTLVNDHWKEITEIKDMTLEFESSIHVAYDIFVEGKLFLTLINMPLQVEYSLND